MEAIAGRVEERTERFNPFPGLRPFEQAESYLFFGRQIQTEEVLRRLSRHRFLAVVGSSGSGVGPAKARGRGGGRRESARSGVGEEFGRGGHARFGRSAPWDCHVAGGTAEYDD